MSDNIETKYWFTNKQVITLLLVVGSLCINGTLIYARFTQIEAEIHVLEDRLDKKIKIINENTHDISKLKNSK